MNYSQKTALVIPPTDALGYTFTDSKTYFYEGNSARGTFDEALKYCNDRNDSMVTLSNPREGRFISLLKMGSSCIWLGARSSNVSLHYTSSKDDTSTNGCYQTWLDGSSFTYTAWKRYRPYCTKTTHTCLMQSSKSGKDEWIDGSCDDKCHFICEGGPLINDINEFRLLYRVIVTHHHVSCL